MSMFFQDYFLDARNFQDCFLVNGGNIMETLLYQRVKLLCSEHNITINKLESELRFAPSTIQKWKSVNSPSISKVVEVANYFNVSIDYLLGRTEIKGSADEILNDTEIISLQRAKENMHDGDWERGYNMLRAGFGYAFRDKKKDDDS